jgi:hypothetical protein
MNTSTDDRRNDRRNDRDAHDYLPADLAAQLPPLYATESQGDDAVAYVKLFTPDSSWTWYLTEYDPHEGLCFGLVIGDETELGYVSLDELRAARGPMGLRIERDLWFTPTSLSDIRSGTVR